MNGDMPPLKYMWIAEYRDGTAIPQFDPDTGKENMWSDVDQDKVYRVSWCEFSKDMKKKVELDTISVRKPEMHSIEYGAGDEIMICRRNHLDFSSSGNVNGHRIEYVLGRNGVELLTL